MPKLTLTAAERAQLLTWLDEPGGLRSPTATHPDDIAQRELYEFLLANDGQNVRPQDFPATWRAVIRSIRDSLVLAQAEGRWNANRTTQLAFYDKTQTLSGA